MADKTTTGLTGATLPLDGTELHYVVQGGNSRKVVGSEVVKIAHNQAWSTITGTPTTLSGYGITDAATSTQGGKADTALQPGAIGSTVQAQGATLDSLEGLSLVSGDVLYATAADTLARLAKGSDGQVLKLASGAPSWGTVAGTGDVVGPASSTTDHIALFSDATGKLLKDSGMKISDIGTGDMLSANNLSDLASADTALTNLGAGAAGKVIFADADGQATLDQIIDKDFTASITGAVGTPLQGLLDEKLSVTMFGGAPGNTTSANKAALQLAIAAADSVGGGVVVVPPNVNYGRDRQDKTTQPDFSGTVNDIVVIDYSKGNSYTSPSKDGMQVHYFFSTPQTTPAGLHDGNTFWLHGDWSVWYVLDHTATYAAAGDPSRTADDNRRLRIGYFNEGVTAWSLGQGTKTGSTYSDAELQAFSLAVNGIPALSVSGLTNLLEIQKTDASVRWDGGHWQYYFRTGSSSPSAAWTVLGDVDTSIVLGNSANTVSIATKASSSADTLNLSVNGSTRFGIKDNGSVFVTGAILAGLSGPVSGDAAVHTFYRATSSQSDIIAMFRAGTATAATLMAVSGTDGNAANAGMRLRADGSTSRSINAGGTINASGADYAEYRMVKPGLSAAKGALLGVSADGAMTDKWSEITGRVFVKSTAPNLVGNDIWGTEENICAAYGVEPIGQVPLSTMPTYAPPGEPFPEHDDTVERAEGQSDESLAEQQAARDAALQKWREDLAAYQSAFEAKAHAAKAFDDEQMAAYEARKQAFETALETERLRWDRIAMCGTVPANVAAATGDIGKYLIPIEGPDDSISVEIVSAADLTLPQYITSFGMIEAIRDDGRPDVMVKIT